MEGAPSWQTVPPQAGAGETGEVSQNDRTMGLFVHLSALAGIVIPLGTFLGPLIVWLVKKDESRFVDDQGKEAVNFQLTLLIGAIVVTAFLFVAMILSMILIGIPLLVLGFLALAGITLASFIFAIIGALKANEGIWYRYPFKIEFVK
jgi:uncharacterized protein